jgi:hypothetical protein
MIQRKLETMTHNKMKTYENDSLENYKNFMSQAPRVLSVPVAVLGMILSLAVLPLVLLIGLHSALKNIHLSTIRKD